MVYKIDCAAFLEVNNYQPGDLKVLSLDQDEG